MSKALASPSTLPEAGLDLPSAVTAYRDWLVEQALIRTAGNVTEAAKLLRIKRTTLMAIQRTPTPVRFVPRRGEQPSEPVAEQATEAEPTTRVRARVRRGAAPIVAPAPAQPTEPGHERDGVLGISPRAVAELKAKGLSNLAIAHELGCNRYMVEKILRQPMGLAKCGERREP